MKNLMLSALVISTLAACAQRLQQRVQPGASAADKPLATSVTLNTDLPASLPKVDPKPEVINIVNPPKSEPDAKAILDDEAKRAGDPPKVSAAPVTREDPATRPPTVTVPSVSTELPSNCDVEFQSLSDVEGARVLSRFAGTWANEKMALSLGPKNEQISFSTVTRNEAGAISSTEKKGQAVSYTVSQDINGYRLVSIMMSSTAGERLTCKVVGVRHVSSGSSKGLLYLIPPPPKSTSPQSFVTEGKAHEHTLRFETF